MEANIAFASTGYGPLWAPAVSSWLRTVAYTARYCEISHLGKIGGAGVTDRTYTHAAENKLVSEMLTDPTFTHLFMTESDMILPHDCIVKLLAMDKDMASGVYFLRADSQRDAGQPCLYKRAPRTLEQDEKRNAEYMHSPVKLFPRSHPFRVDCAGLGCVLFKRRVFESWPGPWFNLDAGAPDRHGYGSDIYFYKEVKDRGFELWVDPSIQCGQIDYYETDLSDYEWQLRNDPKFASTGYIIGDDVGT
jgi:hypothetical protein